MAAETPADLSAGGHLPGSRRALRRLPLGRECATRRREDDLSLVAGITARQRRALKERGVATREALGASPLPMEPPLDGREPSGRSSGCASRPGSRSRAKDAVRSATSC